MGANASLRMGVVEPGPRRPSRVPEDDLTVIVGSRGEGGADTDSEPESEGWSKEDLSISFGYQCKRQTLSDEESSGRSYQSSEGLQDDAHGMAAKPLARKSGSFTCLSGAAVSANMTLANTALGNGFIGEELLPGLDSPRAFRKLISSSSLSKLDLSSRHSPVSETTSPVSATHHLPPIPHSPENVAQISSAPSRMETASFLDAADVQTAGGAAGEDRVQAVCSEEYGWLFCGIYDGFNGRDAADFLAGTFYETVAEHMKVLDWNLLREGESVDACSPGEGVGLLSGSGLADSSPKDEEASLVRGADDWDFAADEGFHQSVMQGLARAFAQTENDFLEMVEQEMDERPELVMVGSCVLGVLLHGSNLYTLNVGDSRAVLATTQRVENSIACDRVEGGSLWAVQLTESHVVDNPDESNRIISAHPDDQGAISGGRLKGKLKVTRAFGAGYLKQAKLNNALMGILRIKNLASPPYLGVDPCISAHSVSKDDSFVIVGSDGLFDFFTNEEVVDHVYNYVLENPTGDPAKYMVDQLLLRAAENAGMTLDCLKEIPIGKRRKYHDDVTVIVIALGAQFDFSTATTVSVEQTA